MNSIWNNTCTLEKRQSLKNKIETEVVVIGAGMAGILIAYHLQKSGRKVVVLEANTIGSGQSSHTTGKLTFQHSGVYSSIMKQYGQEVAGQYAKANEEAIKQYQQLIKEECIHCDFEEQNAYWYCDNAERLEEERFAMEQLKLPYEYVRKAPVSIEMVGGLKVEHQAQFHPLKFIKALSEKLTIYEQSEVIQVEENEAFTKNGSVVASQIVFACHFPFINTSGMYFARMHQERSYVLALKNVNIDGMYLFDGKEHYSLRQYHNCVLLGGGNHRTGENKQGGKYEQLREKARRWFPAGEEVAHWSAQDCMTLDKIPYIGVYAKTKPNWYVATGFQKWGMTTSMVSALLLTDMICGRKNPYEVVFTPERSMIQNLPTLATEGGKAIKGLIKRVWKIPDSTVKELEIGHGGVVSYEGEKIGVYKENNGNVHMVTIQCPHLGCQLEWNPDEKTWDCPCHGSRFDYRGACISNPAQEGITIERIF